MVEGARKGCAGSSVVVSRVCEWLVWKRVGALLWVWCVRGVRGVEEVSGVRCGERW